MADISRDYQHIIKQLNGRTRIIVSGPQRSGTTICAKMISVDLDCTFYPEERINISNPDAVHKLIETEDRFVLQCPALCHYLDTFDATIIMMIRPIDEIITSELRVGWQGHRQKELKKYGLEDGIISMVKYDHWQSIQRALCKRWFEIDYHTLSNHPLWIDERTNFETRQIGYHTVLPASK